MGELHRDPSLQELLDRMVQLECKLSALQSALTKRFDGQLAPVKAKLDDLGNSFELEIKDTSAHFKAVYGHVRDIHERLRGIHEQLWPLVHKVFPGSDKTQRQIAAIVKTAGRSWEEKKRK
jgi:hypothetical protein